MIFHAALQSFADEYSRRLIGNCMEQFLSAPSGEESEWIQNTPQPNIYLPGQYEKLTEWYVELNEEALCKLTRKFDTEFG